MAVPQVLDFVLGRALVEVEEEVWLVGDFSMCYLLGRIRRKGGYSLEEAGHGRVHLWG